MISRRFLLAPVLTLVAVPVAAGAGTQKVESEITYGNSVENAMFIHEGRVKSELRKCERGRTVRLYGEGGGGAFASDETNAKGRYRITMPGDGIVGDYYTRVRELERGSVICKAAESKHKPLSVG